MVPIQKPAKHPSFPIPSQPVAPPITPFPAFPDLPNLGSMTSTWSKREIEIAKLFAEYKIFGNNPQSTTLSSPWTFVKGDDFVLLIQGRGTKVLLKQEQGFQGGK
jgi:hypothetical protein